MVRLFPRNSTQDMDEDRFVALKTAFVTASTENLHGLKSFVRPKEAPELLHRYLAVIGVPIVPEADRRKWPVVKWGDPNVCLEINIEDVFPHCLAISALSGNPGRRHLLLYFLGYMACYLSTVGVHTRRYNKDTELLLDLYAPFIFGNKFDHRENVDILRLLIAQAQTILTYFCNGGSSTKQNAVIVGGVGRSDSNEQPKKIGMRDKISMLGRLLIYGS